MFEVISTKILVVQISQRKKYLCQINWLMGIYGTLNYQNFIEMTSNMIYIVALGGGFKCPCKIHLNTQSGEGAKVAIFAYFQY